MAAGPSDQNRVAMGEAVRHPPSQGTIALAAAFAIFVLAWGCFIFDLVVPIYPRNFETLPIPLRAILMGAVVANVVPLVLSIRAIAGRRGFQPALIALVMSSIGIVFCVTAILL